MIMSEPEARGPEEHDMIRYLLGRIGQAVLVLLVTFTAAFLLLQALPGDAIMIRFMTMGW